MNNVFVLVWKSNGRSDDIEVFESDRACIRRARKIIDKYYGSDMREQSINVLDEHMYYATTDDGNDTIEITQHVVYF